MRSEILFSPTEFRTRWFGVVPGEVVTPASGDLPADAGHNSHRA
jgi:hypothetical protein